MFILYVSYLRFIPEKSFDLNNFYKVADVSTIALVLDIVTAGMGAAEFLRNKLEN